MRPGTPTVTSPGLPVALDVMGGDHAPEALVDGAVMAARQGCSVLLVGDAAAIRAQMPADIELPVIDAPDVVGMDEAPAAAVRRKPEASINRAVGAIPGGEACAAVCCGNTGAAMAASLFGLGRLPGVQRPAVTSVVPRTDGGRLVLLDLGANVDCRPEHLAQFALMGHAFARGVLGQSRPAVGLLSNGSEAGKGNELVRAASALVEALPINYVGNIEPLEAFRGGCDVLVCDGFVGNVMLKTAEATAEVVGALLKEEILRDLSGKAGAWLLQGAFRRFRDRTDYAAVGGALLLGVNGVVVVGHGRSDARAVASAIRFAHHCAAERLHQRLAALF